MLVCKMYISVILEDKFDPTKSENLPILVLAGCKSDTIDKWLSKIRPICIYE